MYPNWRTVACHFAFYELSPTIDHVLPVSRGGSDSEDNWVTTSMVRNSAKANFTLEELGWSLCPAGDMEEWDGLMGWFVAQGKTNPIIGSDAYLRQWLRVAQNARTKGQAQFGLPSVPPVALDRAVCR
jgi:hypothetical protein